MNWARVYAVITALMIQVCEGAAPHSDTSDSDPTILPSPTEDSWGFAEAAVRQFVRPHDPPCEGNADCRLTSVPLPGIGELACIQPGKPISAPALAYEGPYNSAHYNIRPKWKNRLENCGQKTSMCAFLRVVEAFESTCRGEGCRVHYGDFFSPQAHRIHESHGSAECVDVLPFRNGDDIVTGLSAYSRNYNRQRTRAFLAIARAMGATQTIFTDSRTEPHMVLDGHADHIHLCFPQKSPVVQAACAGDTGAVVLALNEAEGAARSAGKRKLVNIIARAGTKPPLQALAPVKNQAAANRQALESVAPAQNF